MNKPITLVSGRGGTGKTEVVSAVLKAVEEELKHSDFEKMENCNITEDGVNSDASFMSKDRDDFPDSDEALLGMAKEAESNDDKSKPKSDTMNGPILYCAPTGKAASVIKKRVGSKAYTIHQVISSYKMWKQSEQISPWKFSAVRIVAVDECSMVSIEVIQWLLKYLIEGSKLCKIVFSS